MTCGAPLPENPRPGQHVLNDRETEFMSKRKPYRRQPKNPTTKYVVRVFQELNFWREEWKRIQRMSREPTRTPHDQHPGRQGRSGQGRSDQEAEAVA